MGFIDKRYYIDTFNGTAIPDSELCRLIDIASTVVESLITVDFFGISTTAFEAIKKATAYEVECLYKQGGLNATAGFADGFFAGSESLGSYSVSSGSSSSSSKSEKIPMLNGVPVSPLAKQILLNHGLMVRWAYAKRHRRRGRL